MSRQQPRIPQSCPPGFLGRYTVRRGDTFYNLARIFRTRLEALAVNNPHIPDPNVIFPGDVLCAPGAIPFPCCVVLHIRGAPPFGAGGVIFINFGPRGGQSASFMATLPQPSFFGNFNAYLAEINIPDIGIFGLQLLPTTEDPPTWTGRIELPTAATVLPNSSAQIFPYNTVTGRQGPVILAGVIPGGSCR